MKRVSIVILCLGGVLVGGIAGLRSCQREGWERMLYGPYAGFAFAGQITNQPVSILPIRSRGQLEVYEPAGEIAPVVVLRSKTGVVEWSRLLLPEQGFEGGQLKRAAVRDLRLKRLERDRNGHEVLFSCDWDWGGKEAGLIDLDNQYRFKTFRISW